MRYLQLGVGLFLPGYGQARRGNDTIGSFKQAAHSNAVPGKGVKRKEASETKFGTGSEPANLQIAWCLLQLQSYI